MSLFKINAVAVNPREPERQTAPIEALVDTGSELSWLPRDVLQAAGITPMRRRSFRTATNTVIERDVGYAIVRAEGHETIDEVVLAEASDMHLLGVRTIEGFGVAVDSVGHRFVAQATLVV